MPTQSFEKVMKGLVDANPEIAHELLEDAVNAMLAGEMDDGRILLRHYVRSSIGFKELAERTGKNEKNLMRSLGPQGNPTSSNLFEIIRACADAEGVTLAAQVVADNHPGGLQPA